MPKPNFIIVGAAKSGTTSLYHYLQQHPDVFLPTIKEPHFFVADEKFNFPVITEQADYDGLFRGVTEKAIGEASTGYLYFPKAARRIKQALPDAKIIVIVRNPVERALSMWGHQVREGLEQRSFEAAIDDEMNGQPRTWHGVEYGFNYCKLGMVAENIRRYQSVFGQKNVFICDYQLLKSDPDTLMRRLFHFLDLPYHNGTYGVKHNVSGQPKWSWLHQFLNSQSALRKAVVKPAKLILPSQYRHNLWQKLRNWNIQSGQRHRLSSKLSSKLETYFAAEIKLLELLIKRSSVC